MVTNAKEKVVNLLSNWRLHACLMAVFCFIMTMEYVGLAYNQYCYMGFDFMVTPERVIGGLLFLTICGTALFVNKVASAFLYLTGICIGLFLCIPSAIMYTIGGISIWPPLYSTLLLLLIVDNRLRFPKYKNKQVSHKCQVIILAVAVLLFTIPFVIKYGLPTNFKVFSLGHEVYDARAVANSKANFITNYLFSPLGKVLLPTILIMGLLHKDWKITLLAVGAMLYLFMVNPHKSVLFSIPIAIAFVFFKRYETKTGAFLLLMVIVLILTVMARVLMNNVLPESILVRRGFFLPTLISDNYFSFFEHNNLTLSHSVMKGFLTYPYELDPAHLMGFMMHEQSITSCNTGIIADGYMNFGHVGVLLWILIVVLLFKYIDSLGVCSAYFGVIFIFLYTLTNSALLTSLLTHGGFVLLLILTFLVERRSEEETTCDL